MSEQAAEARPPESAPSVPPADAADEAGYEVVRRRRRRRRRRRDTADTPSARIHMILLGVIALLLIGSILGQGYRRKFIDSVRHLLPNFAGDLSRRLEIVALVVAALILIYLTPGVEERVLRFLGIKKDKRRGGR